MLFQALLIGFAASQQCNNPTIRPAWRSLSDAQRRALLNAINAVKRRAPGAPGNMASWNFDQFVQVHYDNNGPIHGRDMFLPWHRYFTWGYEMALKSIDPSVNLPYWDWTLDSQNPRGADIFSAQYFGGNGAGADQCVPDGVVRDWTVSYPPPPARTSITCLRRCFLPNTYFTPEQLTAATSMVDQFSELRANMEGGSHGVVHLQIGGQCNDGLPADMGTMYSVNDPIFFMHHAMVDRVWYRWQMGCSAFFNQQGTLTNEPMVGLGDLPLRSVISTTTGPLCYNYGPSAGDLPLRLRCPAGSGPVPVFNGTGLPDTPPSGNTGNWFKDALRALLPSTIGKSSATMQVDEPVYNPEKVPEHQSAHCVGEGCGIKPAPRTPDEYLKKMLSMTDLEIKKFREAEEATIAAVNELTSDPNYVSNAALVNFCKWNPLRCHSSA
jgi:hypothetical protein